MTNANHILECHETAAYELFLIEARSMDPDDAKACERFLERIEAAYNVDTISAAMAQYICSTLSKRQTHE